MRDLGSGSAVLADADRKPCGEDVSGCVQVTVVACPAVRACPCPDLKAGHALRPGLRPAMGADLRTRIILVDGDELSPVPFGLVFEHSTELGPSGVHDAPAQPGFPGLPVGEPMVRIVRVGFRRTPFGHVLHVEVFEYHRLVLADYPRAQLVEEVTAHVRDSGVGASHLEGCFPTIVAPYLRRLACFGDTGGIKRLCGLVASRTVSRRAYQSMRRNVSARVSASSSNTASSLSSF